MGRVKPVEEVNGGMHGLWPKASALECFAMAISCRGGERFGVVKEWEKTSRLAIPSLSCCGNFALWHG
jgi:hypothetical protein